MRVVEEFARETAYATHGRANAAVTRCSDYSVLHVQVHEVSLPPDTYFGLKFYTVQNTVCFAGSPLRATSIPGGSDRSAADKKRLK